MIYAHKVVVTKPEEKRDLGIDENTLKQISEEQGVTM
jgi:hypothetical protein